MAERLKPVVYTATSYKRGAKAPYTQMMLLKALQVTQDPKELRRMLHVKTVSDVYRTLDKLAMRKEYHEALTRAGISFDFIVGGIKDIAKDGYKDGDKLKALQVLLKSLGLEKYEEASGPSAGSWEDVLLKKIEDTQKAQT